MAQAITDAHVVSVLKVVVRGSGPVLDALTRTDPFGWKQRTREPRVVEVPHEAANVVVRLKDKAVHAAVEGFHNTEYPGTAAWERMDVRARSDWWVNRIGRFTTLLVSIPGLGGIVADRFPVQDTLGAASQAMVLCAVAREHGVTDEGDQVRMLAQVLSRRTVSRELVASTAERSEQTLDAEGVRAEPGRGRSSVVTAGRALWRYGRVLRSILGELDKRPQGGFVSGMVGKLPVVGIAGDYLSERSALKKAVRQGEEWMRTHAHAPDAPKTLH
ncbi:hypothetical protein RHODO2019_12405 [Rhodococcus antarcticus]|uniref:EcsC family protein n=1 Tax=Rhodococcus antarcticus TaxID=2987751 RepID=A0ABY6NY67_9NOCA|nr:hypothetical protein [Rhodococcus antarcticus]UZJ23981.1 hypothetical protein RHODO2019_12405 [Rhodococcus antarcticus]